MKKRIGWLLSHVVLFASILMLNGCDDNTPPPPEKPDMPISVSIRKAAFSDGLVAQFSNQSDRNLKIRIYISNKTINDKKDVYIQIPPHTYKEMGWAEGWNFASGETITMIHEDYKTKTVEVL